MKSKIFFISPLNLILILLFKISILGCLRTEHKLFLKESERKKHQEEKLIKKANDEARWDEIQAHLRNFNGRIEVLEEQIKKQSLLLKETQSKVELKNEIIKERLKTFIEALKSFEIELKELKQVALKKQSRKQSKKKLKKPKRKLKKPKTKNTNTKKSKKI